MAFYSPLSNQFNNYLWTLLRVFTQKYKFNCTIETEKAEETVLSQQQIARLISYSLTRLIKKKTNLSLLSHFFVWQTYTINMSLAFMC